jgi:redox-sensitive bicupin YhaK (pirin superfamily)
MAAGAHLELPEARSGETARVLYVFEGSALRVGGEEVAGAHGALVDASVPLELVAAAHGPVEVLMLQGRPIGEPVAQYGPFVMNTRAEIQQAVEDYQRTGFGGWPWPQDDPVHGPDARRFARHADGHLDEAEAIPAAR